MPAGLAVHEEQHVVLAGPGDDELADLVDLGRHRMVRGELFDAEDARAVAEALAANAERPVLLVMFLVCRLLRHGPSVRGS